MRKPTGPLILVAALLAAVAWLLFRGDPAQPSDPSAIRSLQPAGEGEGDAAGTKEAKLPGDEGAPGVRVAAGPEGLRRGTIRGRVLAADGGQPVADVEVAAIDRHPAFAQFEVRLRDFIEEGFWKPREIPEVKVLGATRTEADGSFVLEGLPSGRVFLDARSGSWYTRSYPGVRLARGEEHDGTTILVSPGGRLRGTVLDPAGAPVARARIVLRPSATAFLAQLTSRSFRWSETRTDEEGCFDLPGIPPGVGYAVSAMAPGWALAQVREIAVARGRTTDVVLRCTGGAVLEGTVRRPDGEPVPGALVGFAYLDLARVLFSLGPENPVAADEHGRFRLAHVGAGQVGVSALAADLALAAVHRLTVVEGGSYQVDLELSIGFQVEGTVVDEAGAPVPGARVSARTLEQPRGLDLALVAKLVRHEATTGEDGTFALRGLASDRMYLEADKDGYLTSRKTYRRQRDPGPVRLVLRKGVFLEGRVLEESEAPVTRFRVLARSSRERRLPLGPRWGRPQARPNPYTDRSPWLRGGEFEVQDAEGRFRVGPLEPGRLELSVDAKGFVPSERRTLEVDPEQEPAPLEFRLSRGVRLRGRVVAQGSGRPVGEAQVTWRRHREPGGRRGLLPFRITAEPEDLDFMAMDATFGSRSMLTNERGEFAFEGVAPGKVNLTARHPSYAKASQRGLELFANAQLPEIVLTLTAGGAIEGTVTGLDREPAKSAMVVAFSIAKGVLRSTTTNESGYYKMTGLTPGPYVVAKTKLDAALTTLFADALGNVRLKSTSVREGRTSRVDIEDRTEGGVDVFGRITLGGEPVPRAVVTLLGQDRAGPFGVGLRTATADDQGTYELASVSAGSYVCQITRYTSRRPLVSSQPIRIEGGRTRVRIDLEFPSGEIAGRVTDPSGKGIRGVRLQAVQEDGAPSPGGLIGLMREFGGASRARSSEGGEFRISRLPPGRWQVRAVPRGPSSDLYGAAEVTGLDLAAGQKLAGVRLVLPFACVLAGTVTDGLGQPVAGATVRCVAVGAGNAQPRTGEAAPQDAFLQDGRGLRALARQFRQVTRTGNDGRFRLPGLMPGSWQVLAEKEGLAAARGETVRLDVGPNRPVELRMVRAGHVWVRVVDLDGSLMARGRVRVLDSSGRTVGGQKSLFAVMASLFRSERADGGSEWWDMGTLPPDRYTLEVTREGKDGAKDVRRTSRVLREGEQARWEVKMADLVKKGG